MSSSTPTGAGPTTLTWDANDAPSLLDTNYGGAGGALDIVISENVFEQLLWYNGTCGTCVIPWLAANYTHSADYKTWTFNLRQGITYADGEPFNASSVYFSFNRALIEDSSAPFGHGVGFTYEIQQFLNTSLSTANCGCTQTYNDNYVKAVLAENFVQINGPYSVTLNLQTGFAAFPYLLAAANFAGMVPPKFDMQNDPAYWSSTAGGGYTMPYPTPSGSTLTAYHQYFDDMMAVCNTGPTPAACGGSYTDSAPGPNAVPGTGPYEIVNWNKATNVLTLKANPNYWGGAWPTKTKPYFQTIKVQDVGSSQTRVLDLTAAANSGAAYVVDTDLSGVQSLINRNDWLNNHQMVSVVPGVTINGPNTISEVNFFSIASNTTNPFTGKFETFQPWSDLRIRQAIADSVNVSAINQADNLGLADLVDSPVSPAYNPTGSYNTSTTPGYSFNPDESATLLLAAMEKPITTFHFYNGTLAPAGFFNNTFGCAQLNSKNQCSDPVQQTILLTADPSRTYDTAIVSAIAEAMNNISTVYNMGLNFEVNSEPISIYSTNQYAVLGSVSWCWDGGWPMFYPYILDALGGTAANIAAGYMPIDRDNYTAIQTLYNQAFAAAEAGNNTQLLNLTWKIEQTLNNNVFYFIEGEPEYITATTSNIHGYFFNPSLITDESGSGTMYFATWYATG